MKKNIITVLLALLTLALATTVAQAAITTENYTGTISYAADDNVFGVSLNDTFTWSTTYDLSYLADDGYLVIGDSTDMALSVTIGSRSFIETEDEYYGSGTFGAPLLAFDDENNIAGISFVVIDDTNGYQFVTGSDKTTFGVYLLDDEGVRTDTEIVTGVFSFEPTAVPVPAAAWLLGSGLLGLIGLRRRKA